MPAIPATMPRGGAAAANTGFAACGLIVMRLTTPEMKVRP